MIDGQWKCLVAQFTPGVLCCYWPGMIIDHSGCVSEILPMSSKFNMYYFSLDWCWLCHSILFYCKYLFASYRRVEVGIIITFGNHLLPRDKRYCHACSRHIIFASDYKRSLSVKQLGAPAGVGRATTALTNIERDGKTKSIRFIAFCCRSNTPHHNHHLPPSPSWSSMIMVMAWTMTFDHRTAGHYHYHYHRLPLPPYQYQSTSHRAY